MATIAERFVRVRADTSDLRSEVADSADKAGTEAGNSLRDKIKAGALVAGVAAGALLVKGISDAMDQLNAASMLQAQLGSTNGVAARHGKIAGRLFASGVTDSFEDAAASIRATMTSGLAPPGATNKQIESISAKVTDLATVFDADLGQAANAAGQLMKTGLAKNATEAIDLITRGFQTMGPRADDLIDTVNEYSGQFQKLGLTGKSALGLLSQGMKAGARDTDFVADALKEFSIRAVDGSKASADGFKLLGLNARAMTAQIAKGGAPAAAGLQAVLDRLRAMKDPVKREAAAVALFGTKAEDLGKSLFALDPSKAANALGVVEGAAAKVGKTIRSGPAHQLTVFKRRLQQNLVTFLGGTVLPAITKVGETLNANLGPALKTAAGALRSVVATGARFARWIEEGSTGAVILSSVMGGLIAAFLAYKIALIAAATYTKIIAAVTRVWVGIQAALNAVMALSPLALIVLAIVALVAAIVIAYKRSETFRRVVDQAWAAIKVAIKFAWENVIKPVFTIWWAYIKILARVVMWLWRSIIKPAWNGIKLAIKVAWFFINLYIMAWRKVIEKVIAPVLRWLWQKIVKPVFKGVWETIKFAWTRGIKPVFQALAGFIKKYIVPGFKLGISAIKKTWNTLIGIAKKPVNFLINPVYMHGIRKVFNTAARYLGVSQRLPVVRRFADGGVMPGYQPGRDTIPALLSPGEGILRPEVVRALGPDQIYAWNKAAKQKKSIAAFADGGIVGFFRNPVGFIKDKVNSKISGIVQRFGNSNLTRLITALPRKILGNLVTWAKKKVASFFGGGGLGSSPGGSVATIMRIARMFQSNARLTSGYRPGDPGWHGRGLAADIIGGGGSGMARIARGFYRLSGRLLELIHSGGGGYFVKNGRRVGRGFYGREVANHWDHVHVAARRDALARVVRSNFGNFVADTGTTLMPGWNLRYNGLGRPEPLVPAETRGITRADFRELVRELKAAGLVLVATDPNRSIGARANQLRRG